MEIDYGSIFGWFANLAAQNLLITVLLVIFVILAVMKWLRKFRWPDSLRDDVRAFTLSEKKEALENCDHRCEWITWYGNRCDETTSLAGDHHYPWSKGGKTRPANLVMLCRDHNSRKTNHWPSLFYTFRLTMSRKRYFPNGMSTKPRKR